MLLGRSPVGMGPNRRPLPLYVTLYTLTMTTLPLTSYVMPDWSVTALDLDSWDTESLMPDVFTAYIEVDTVFIYRNNLAADIKLHSSIPGVKRHTSRTV